MLSLFYFFIFLSLSPQVFLSIGYGSVRLKICLTVPHLISAQMAVASRGGEAFLYSKFAGQFCSILKSRPYTQPSSKFSFNNKTIKPGTLMKKKSDSAIPL